MRVAASLPVCVVPAGPVSDQTRGEIRVRFVNNDATQSRHQVQFFLDKSEPASLVSKQSVVVPADRSAIPFLLSAPA